MGNDGDFDYQGEAVAAMKMAVATNGFERIKWVRVAQAWQDLGRGRIAGAGDCPLAIAPGLPTQTD